MANAINCTALYLSRSFVRLLGRHANYISNYIHFQLLMLQSSQGQGNRTTPVDDNSKTHYYHLDSKAC